MADLDPKKRKPQSSNEPVTELPPDDESAIALLADEAPIAPNKTPCEGIYVMATRDGTYPRKGDTYGIYRSAGDVFELNFVEDFANHRLPGGWMRRVKPGEAIPQEQAPVIPQTAQRGQQRRINPFPPHAG